ncbi:DUF397 domain-containing protein [Streptomyces sp. NPDC055078]
MHRTDLTDARWFTSSYSDGQHNCVEVAHIVGGTVATRDSKNPTGPALTFAPANWRAFLAGTTAGVFDQR